jgi:hypothetical protein
MNIKKSDQKPKTISELCGEDAGGFERFLIQENQKFTEIKKEISTNNNSMIKKIFNEWLVAIKSAPSFIAESNKIAWNDSRKRFTPIGFICIGLPTIVLMNILLLTVIILCCFPLTFLLMFGIYSIVNWLDTNPVSKFTAQINKIFFK